MLWTRLKPIHLNRTNHLNLRNQHYYHSPRNIHQLHRPHPLLLVTPLPPPREKWSLLPRVMYRSSRPHPRQATGSMLPYPQLNLLYRVSKYHRRLLITWCPGSDRTMAAQYNRMGLTVRYALFVEKGWLERNMLARQHLVCKRLLTWMLACPLWK